MSCSFLSCGALGSGVFIGALGMMDEWKQVCGCVSGLSFR